MNYPSVDSPYGTHDVEGNYITPMQKEILEGQIFRMTKDCPINNPYNNADGIQSSIKPTHGMNYGKPFKHKPQGESYIDNHSYYIQLINELKSRVFILEEQVKLLSEDAINLQRIARSL